MVKLKEIYDKTENPLEKQGVLEKIIQAYADSERTSLSTPSNLYEYLVTMNQNKDNTRVNKKDEENFYVETYNEWIENMLNLNSSDIKKLEESGIKAKEMQKYLNAFGKVSSMEDIKRLNKNPLFDETGSVNGWQINTSSWEHVKSRLVKARQEGSLSIKHRLYVGCQMQDLWKFAKDFKDKCNEKQIPYYFKLATNTRDDKMVIYADTDNLTDYIEILQEIKRENPDLANRCAPPPVLTRKIDGWIGIGDEPLKDKHGKNQSYNGLRAKIFENSVEEALLKDILDFKGQDVIYNGQKASFNKLFIDSATNTIINELTQNGIESWHGIKEEDLKNEKFKEHIKTQLKKNMTKGLNKLLEVKDIKDELEVSNFDAIFTIPTREDKGIGVNTFTMDKIIKNAVPLIRQVDPKFTEKVKSTIEEKSRENGIDETFCFQKGSKERFEKEDAKRALESKTREVREEISKKDKGIDEKRIDDKTKTNEGQNRKSIVKRLNSNLMKERVILPNGRDISSKQYIEEYVLPNLESSDGKVTLKNNNQIPIKQYIEEFVLGGGTKSYHGDINALLENTTKKVNTSVIDNRKTKEVNQKEILSTSGNNEENRREKPSEIKKQTLEYFRKEKLSQNDDKEKNKESQIDNKLDEAQERI